MEGCIMQDLKVPPYSLVAEQSVLGAMIISDVNHYAIVELINAEHFYVLSHAEIYKAIKILLESKKPVDLLTISGLMESLGTLESVGGMAYIGELARNTPSSANVVTYCEMVIMEWNGRKIIEACHKALDQVYSKSGYKKARESLYSDIEPLFIERGENEIADASELCESFINELERLGKTEGGMSGLCTGDKHLDNATGGLHPGDYLAIAGRSGSGKTTRAMNILAHYTKMGRRSLFFSMEMKRQKGMMKLVSDIGNVPFSAIKSADLNDYQWSCASNAIEIVKKSKLHIDDSSGLSIGDIERKARQLKAKYNELDLIVVDYIQRLKIDSNSMYAELTNASNRLKDLAMELGASVIVIAQLKKNSTGFPNASDLRETGAIENDSDVLMFLHTPSEDLKPHKGMLTCEIFNKVRFGETGVKMLENHLDYQRFECVDTEYVEAETKDRFS
jgi:replicative DNA helicase